VELAKAPAGRQRSIADCSRNSSTLCRVVDTTGLRAPDSERPERPGFRKAVHHVLCFKNEGKSLLLRDPLCWRGGDLLRCLQLSLCLTVLLNCSVVARWKDFTVLVAPSQKHMGKAFLEKKKTETLFLFRGLQQYSHICL